MANATPFSTQSSVDDTSYNAAPAERIPPELWCSVLSLLRLPELLAIARINYRLSVLSRPYIQKEGTLSTRFRVLSTDLRHGYCPIPPHVTLPITEPDRHSGRVASIDLLFKGNWALGAILGAVLREPEAAAAYTETLNVDCEPFDTDHGTLKALALTLGDYDRFAAQRLLDLHIRHDIAFSDNSFHPAFDVVDEKVREVLRASKWINNTLLEPNDLAALLLSDDMSILGIYQGSTELNARRDHGLNVCQWNYSRAVMRGETDAILALLLTLLPNLRTLRCSGGGGLDRREVGLLGRRDTRLCWFRRGFPGPYRYPKVQALASSLCRMCCAGQPPARACSQHDGCACENKRARNHPLGKLTTIKPVFGTALPLHIEHVIPFLSLPSLRYVECHCEALSNERRHLDWKADWYEPFHWIKRLKGQLELLPGRSRVNELYIQGGTWVAAEIKWFAKRALAGPCTVKQLAKNGSPSSVPHMDDANFAEWNVFYAPCYRDYFFGDTDPEKYPSETEVERQQRGLENSRAWESNFKLDFVNFDRGNDSIRSPYSFW